MYLDIGKLSEKGVEWLSLGIFKKGIDKHLLRRDGYDCAGPGSFALFSTLFISLLLLLFMILLLVLYRTASPHSADATTVSQEVKTKTHTRKKLSIILKYLLKK